jgi:16S rRNA (cytosine967-C5)-methyltransferase
MTTDPTRGAALHMLKTVLDQRRPLDAGLDDIEAAPRDRAAAHRLAAAVLRRLGTLDAVLEPFLRRAPPPEIRHVLRLGAAGLLLLRTPPHAAVATAVSLASGAGLRPFSGLVNAVLRKIAAAGPALLDGLDSPRLDTPAWLWTSWGEDARGIALAHQHEAPLDLTLRPGIAPWDGAERLPTGSLRLPPGTPVRTLAGYDAGAFWVQDAAAALPVLLLAPRPDETIIDLCAAPGGKTAQLAAAGAVVTSVERDSKRLQMLDRNLKRLRLRARTVRADALDFQPETPADAVLLDAPCSATGTIRRHPDVPHLKRARDIPALTAQQDQLLARAALMLKPGGRLVYAVCSLQPEEGQDRIDAALATGMWDAAPFTEAEFAGFPSPPTPSGALRTTPAQWTDHGGLDGFFAARLIRK